MIKIQLSCQACASDFFKAYGIQLVTVSPTNHKSLQAEHGIKSLSNILMKHLSGLGDDWHLYIRPAMLNITPTIHLTWTTSAHLNWH